MRRGHGAFLLEHAAGLVTDLPRRARDPEQLVDRHRREERQAPQAARQLGGRQRLEPQLAPALGRHAPLGQRPRRRLEHVPVVHVAVREHVLDVVGQVPQLLRADDVDGGGRHHRVVVVDQLQERFLDVARPRLEQDVAAADPLVARHVLEHRQDPLAQRRRRGCCRGTPRRSTWPRESPCSSVQRAASMSRRRVEQRQELEDAVAQPRHLLLRGPAPAASRPSALPLPNRLSCSDRKLKKRRASWTASFSIGSAGT